MEAGLILPMVGQRFRCSLDNPGPPEFDPQITLLPKDGVHATLTAVRQPVAPGVAMSIADNGDENRRTNDRPNNREGAAADFEIVNRAGAFGEPLQPHAEDRADKPDHDRG